MFHISDKLNKQASAIVIFVDKSFNFINHSNYFSKDQLIQLNLFKDEILKNDFLTVDLFDKRNKIKVIIYKIKDECSDYEFQKTGGVIFNLIRSFEYVNIFLESYTFIFQSIQKVIQFPYAV